MTQQPAGLPRTTCVACSAELPEAAQFCPHCGAKQQADEHKAHSRKKQLSMPTLFGVGAIAALVIGGTSFGITRMVLPDPAPPQAQQQQQAAPQQPVITPEQEATRKAMKDSILANPNNPDLTLRFANLLYDMGEYESAADFYNRYIVRFDSTNPDAYVDYGHTLFRIEKHEEAVQMTKRALDFAPKHQAALFNLGVMSVQMQDRQGAVEWFNRCVQADSTTTLGQQALQVVQQIHNLSASN